jgi:hypothetical protein
MKNLLVISAIALLPFVFFSCQKEGVPGCTNPAALNYNAQATQDNGSCVAKVYGCTDRTATNYNPNANTNDGSCTYNGTVVVWSRTYGNAVVTINGQSATIAQATPQPYVPITSLCGSDLTAQYTANFTLPAGTYNLTANVPGTNTAWTATITVASNVCLLEELP